MSISKILNKRDLWRTMITYVLKFHDIENTDQCHYFQDTPINLSHCFVIHTKDHLGKRKYLRVKTNNFLYVISLITCLFKNLLLYCLSMLTLFNELGVSLNNITRADHWVLNLFFYFCLHFIPLRNFFNYYRPVYIAAPRALIRNVEACVRVYLWETV